MASYKAPTQNTLDRLRKITATPELGYPETRRAQSFTSANLLGSAHVWTDWRAGAKRTSESHSLEVMTIKQNIYWRCIVSIPGIKNGCVGGTHP